MKNTTETVAGGSGFVRIPADEMESELYRALVKHGMTDGKAKTCAEIFTQNSLDGVYTHGINRFMRFVKYIREGYVLPDNECEAVHCAGAVEQWDGQLGPGIINALTCTGRVMELARLHGMGCVALANTNHWMRGGTYGWKAAKEGFIFIAWTNTVANMPAWGAVDCRIGNNPLVIAVPRPPEAVVLDMAASLFSYGKIETYKINGEQLPLPGGFNKNGELTTAPAEILESQRILPAGYWKGSGLSLLLDLLATVLSGGLSTKEISKQDEEHGVSQVFIAIDLSKLHNYQSIVETVEGIIDDYSQSTPENDGKAIAYPGERALKTRMENLSNGIPVNVAVWDEIKAL